MRAALLVLAVAAAVVLAGCTSTPPPTTPPSSPPPSSTPPPAVTFVASDYNFTGPATARPGWSTVALQNTGRELHHMQMVHIGNHTLQEARASLMSEGPPPEWAVSEGGPNTVSPGATERAVMNLRAGNYLLVCFIPDRAGMPHFMHGMMNLLSVTGAPTGAAPPTAEATLELKDFNFTLSQALTAGTHTLRVRNTGTEQHEAPLVKLEGNATAMDFVAAFGPNATGPPPGRGAGGLGNLMPGAESYAIHNLTPGRYAYICFVSNQNGPHFAQGMVHEFTVA